jgi:NDP-sugar pyrophosphorylase family protein
MDNFAEYGCAEFHILLGYKGAMVQSYFDNADCKYALKCRFEKLPCGTGGALKLLPRNITDSFFLSNCDVVIKADYSDIYDFHIRENCDITVVGAMRHLVIPYGVLEVKKNEGGKVNKLTEKPEYDFLVNTGMYVLRKKTLSLVPRKGVFHLTDLIRMVQQGGGKVGVYPISEKSWFDIGQLEYWEEAVSALTDKNTGRGR